MEVQALKSVGVAFCAWLYIKIQYMCLINPVISIQIYYLRVHKVRKGQGARQAYQELRSVPSETKVYIYRKETTNRYTLI